MIYTDYIYLFQARAGSAGRHDRRDCSDAAQRPGVRKQKISDQIARNRRRD